MVQDLEVLGLVKFVFGSERVEAIESGFKF